jgi:hypothetical protein
MNLTHHTPNQIPQKMDPSLYSPHIKHMVTMHSVLDSISDEGGMEVAVAFDF